MKSKTLKNQKAVVVFSGGQDSTTCLFWAKQVFQEVVAVSFHYGQRHSQELEQAKKIAQDLEVEHHVLDMQLLNQLAPNALTRSDIEVEKGIDNKGVPNTFVEGRNMLFLTFTAVLAKTRGINNIVTGVCQTDFSGYPDCRDIFIKSLNTTLNLAMDYDFNLHTPLMWLDKAETWQLADDLGVVDYVANNTLTCYNGVVGTGCGECPACILRAKGYDHYRMVKGARKVVDYIAKGK